MRFQYAPDGYHYVLTERGYLAPRQIIKIKHVLKIGMPIQGYETFVPSAWVEEGYVKLEKVQQ